MRITILLILIALAYVARADDEVILLSPFSVASAKETSPPVSIRKTGDYLLLQVNMVNDTRDPDKRRLEMYDTVKGIISAASEVSNLEVSTREMVLSLQNYQVRLEDQHDKADASSVELLFKLPLLPSDDVAALTSKLRQFSRKVQVVGRTEVFSGEIGISMKNPERFRYEVISKIAEDVKKLKGLFGDGFEILVKGLDQRLQWRRATISEIELYLPYSYEVLPSKAIPFVVNERG